MADLANPPGLKPYMTKYAFGRWWFYRDTRRQWRSRSHKIPGWSLIVVSYRKREDS